ncbi:MAG: hypothetical protein ABW199_12075 [Caulobacterales bacterium]
MRTKIVLAGLMVLAACQTVPVSTSAPGRPIDLAPYQRGSAERAESSFSNMIASRYGAGTPLNRATSDMAANRFSCATPPRGGRGEPPDRLCRRVVQEAGCTHTWQVMLYDTSGQISRARGGYDRVCSAGDDGLLGGR